ncbi:MAG: Uncharacterised protein [Flavobacteriia bacterium]|nr:MAG: Uncharacterised protein [Flavobacteriia bacterium]
MADQYYAPRILLEELLQPYDRFDVQVIGWFIEQQKVVLTNQQLGEFNAHAPSSRKCCRGRFKIGRLKS